MWVDLAQQQLPAGSRPAHILSEPWLSEQETPGPRFPGQSRPPALLAAELGLGAASQGLRAGGGAGLHLPPEGPGLQVLPVSACSFPHEDRLPAPQGSPDPPSAGRALG